MAVLVGTGGWLLSRSGFASRAKESGEGITIDTNSLPSMGQQKISPPSTIKEPNGPTPRTGTDLLTLAKADAILEAQVALDRMGISPGSIDGVAGSQTR